MDRPRLTALLLLILVAIAWGAIPIIVREDVPVSQLVAARVWLGGAALVGVLAARGRLRAPRHDRGRMVAVGVLRAAHWATFFLALKATTVAATLAVLYLGPISAAALAPRLLGERAPRRVLIALVCAFAGVILVVRPWAEGSGAEATGITIDGIAWAVASAALLAAVMLVAKPVAERHGGLTVATAELVVAAVVLAPWAGAALVESREFWPQLLLLGVGLTGVAGALYWGAMSRLPVATVGVVLHLEPASAAIWALLVLDEQPGAIAWLGITVVVASGIMAVSSVRREEAVGVAPAL